MPRPSTSSFKASAGKLVADALSALDFSGVVVVAQHGEVVAEAAAGLADRTTGRKITRRTRFGTASVTKMFTAAATARLVDMGLLDFGTTVRDLLPSDWYPPALDAGVTVHHLLTHTSGLPDYLPDEDPTTPDLWLAMGTPAIRRATDFIPILNALPEGSRPSQTARYCNAGYLVIALVIEAAAGAPYSTVMESEVFAACGMRESALLPFDELGTETAEGYLPPDGGHDSWRTNVDLLPFAGAPDGGAFSTSRDLLKFLLALHYGNLLTAATSRAVLTPWSRDAATPGSATASG